MAACEAFLMNDPETALEHMDLKTVKYYGTEELSAACGRILTERDPDWVFIQRCERCGGYALMMVCDNDFAYYDDGPVLRDVYLYPVESPEQAEELISSSEGLLGLVSQTPGKGVVWRDVRRYHWL